MGPIAVADAFPKRRARNWLVKAFMSRALLRRLSSTKVVTSAGVLSSISRMVHMLRSYEDARGFSSLRHHVLRSVAGDVPMAGELSAEAVLAEGAAAAVWEAAEGIILLGTVTVGAGRAVAARGAAVALADAARRVSAKDFGAARLEAGWEARRVASASASSLIISLRGLMEAAGLAHPTVGEVAGTNCWGEIMDFGAGTALTGREGDTNLSAAAREGLAVSGNLDAAVGAAGGTCRLDSMSKRAA